MTITYNIRAVEQKWRRRWDDTNAHATTNQRIQGQPTKKKKYILEMLPFPSGKLHMGHVRNYAIGDVIARFYKHLGFDVLHPMGWDAFGLPAENAAIQNNQHPKTWTDENIAQMKEQMSQLGFSYDWSKEVTTCDPQYYGLEQQIFLDFYKNGLIYRKKSWVNWDPVEQSVLANEQVINGRGWRSDALVEKKELTQWEVKITAYAQELLDDLKNLKGWPDKVVRMQENWIGQSFGALIDFTLDTPVRIVASNDSGAKDNTAPYSTISVFSTRPETLYGASFLAIAPNHPWSQEAARRHPDLKVFIEKAGQVGTSEAALSTQEKLGMDTGFFVEHPLDKQTKLPVYVANFVIMDYGTGAIFGCPAHDERDYDFAKKYNLPIKPVINPHLDPLAESVKVQQLPNSEKNGSMVNSGFLNGLSVEEAFTTVIKQLELTGKGQGQTIYRLRDWLVSRQRYWGCPIPIIHCDQCGMVAVPLDQLPLKLPEDVTFDKPGNPLDHHPTWKHTTCPSCKGEAERETDTLDTFFESSWYFLRYPCSTHPHPIDKEVVDKWMNVDWYIGGIEHAVLHLLYARFFTKALRDLGYIRSSEPFTNLLTQGMVCHPTYQDEKGQWLYPSQVKKLDSGQKNSGDQWVTIDGEHLVIVGRVEKMSKSKKNLVDPQTILDTYGADCARLFILSDTPVDKDFYWNDDGLEGCWRYLNRLWRIGQKITQQPSTDLDGTQHNLTNPVSLKNDLKNGSMDYQGRKRAHQLFDQITKAYEKIALNKVVALNRELCHFLEDNLTSLSLACQQEIMGFLIMAMAPITPYLCHELWMVLHNNQTTFKECDDLGQCPWLPVDPDLLEEDLVTLAVQINGKLRSTFEAPKDAKDEWVKEYALNLPSLISHLENKNVKKVIVVPNRIVNIVVS